ncbi:MAG: hypothetical protein DMG55_12755 [Acidobacteria bacterium]|nr:MAG: hypothetical protein DMG55_12755 [Acidobacteriota bacterium]
MLSPRSLPFFSTAFAWVYGKFGGFSFERSNADITAADWAPALAVAKENAAAGVTDRMTFRPGSVF